MSIIGTPCPQGRLPRDRGVAAAAAPLHVRLRAAGRAAGQGSPPPHSRERRSCEGHARAPPRPPPASPAASLAPSRRIDPTLICTGPPHRPNPSLHRAIGVAVPPRRRRAVRDGRLQDPKHRDRQGPRQVPLGVERRDEDIHGPALLQGGRGGPARPSADAAAAAAPSAADGALLSGHPGGTQGWGGGGGGGRRPRLFHPNAAAFRGGRRRASECGLSSTRSHRRSPRALLGDARPKNRVAAPTHTSEPSSQSRYLNLLSVCGAAPGPPKILTTCTCTCT